jgi:hypothetical protein
MGRIWEMVKALDAAKATETTIMDMKSKMPVQLDLGDATPRTRLVRCLDLWATMDEATWSEPNVKALLDDIMDLFREYPEADGWFAEWRAAHPAARLT